MPTLEEWEAALSTPRYIKVDSTNSLAQTINRLPDSISFTGRPKKASGLPIFSPPKTIKITPLEILRALGRISTPKIENLTDLSSTWANIRYIWAFVPDQYPSNLRLSNYAQRIDPHQKTILSDEIGIGIASCIIERYFGGLNPIDVQIALQNHVISGLSSQYTTSPDYIFNQINGDLIIVECKCTQSGDRRSLSQLRRGTEQLPSLVFPSNQKTLALVVGTRLSQSDTLVNLIDPPDVPESKGDYKKIIIQNEEEFLEELNLTQISNLYLYSGATIKAGEFVPFPKTKSLIEKLPQRDSPPEEIFIPELEQKYLGISNQFKSLGDVHQINVFQGLSENVYRLLESRNMESVNQEAGIQYQNIKSYSNQVDNTENKIEDSIPIIKAKEENELRVYSLGKDGTCLKISVSKV